MPVQYLNKKSLSNFIKTKAKQLGFFDCGISKVEYLAQDAETMEDWLSHGYQGEMSYLEKNKDKRYNPQLLVENSKSVISVLYNYFPEKEINKTNNYRISKYTYGIDYHYIIKHKLSKLLALIEEKNRQEQCKNFC